MGYTVGEDVIPMQDFIEVLKACVPIFVALVSIIPTIRSNRKKTQESIDKLQDSVNKVSDTLDKHIREDDDNKAREQRYRILQFYDELCEGKKHSESHFEDVLDDIDNYESYCGSHPAFKNNRGKAAMDYIKETYTTIKNKGGFLIHQEGA